MLRCFELCDAAAEEVVDDLEFRDAGLEGAAGGGGGAVLVGGVEGGGGGGAVAEREGEVGVGEVDEAGAVEEVLGCDIGGERGREGVGADGVRRVGALVAGGDDSSWVWVGVGCWQAGGVVKR